LIGLLFWVGCTSPQKNQSKFPLVEATIADIHAAMESGDVTAQYLVEGYLKRIEAYDKQGPSINSIIIINPEAMATAKYLDSIYAVSGMVGPLPVVLFR
jgi:Asp-tRNA(Asn)/Glu-tRNA(Gln) amidotransferase A subunit family amidase